jgi:general secretion pathway protein G
VLQRSMEKRRSGESGFTLVELLVVIVILGILAAIVVFAVGGITDKGTTASCKADQSSLETAEEAAYANNDASVYQSEADLKLNGFIHDVSSLHDIALGAGNKSYTVNPIGKCA